MSDYPDSRKYLGFDADELRLPAPGTPFYTAQEYENALKKGGSYEEILRREEAKGRGFGFVYMHALSENIDSAFDGDMWDRTKTALLFSGNREADFHSKAHRHDNLSPKELVHCFNAVSESIGQSIAGTMQKYIIKRTGVIDCWPEKTTDMLLKNHSHYELSYAEDLTCAFHYFKPSVIRLGENTPAPESVFLNSYDFGLDFPSACSFLWESSWKISCLFGIHQPSFSECMKSHGKLCFHVIRMLIPLIWSLLMLLPKATGFDISALSDSLFDAVGKSGPLSCLMLIPALFIRIPAWLNSSLSELRPLFYLIAALLAGIGIVWLFVLINFIKHKFFITLSDYFKGQRTRLEIAAIRNSPEYKKAEQEHPKIEACYKRLAEKWQRAWFEAV